MYVNSSRGWKDLVHELSHHFHSRRSSDRPHGEAHALLEFNMVRHVIDSGWLDGRFNKPVKPKVNAKLARYQRVLKRLETWERKAKRAETAIKKLRKQARYYEGTVVIGNDTMH